MSDEQTTPAARGWPKGKPRTPVTVTSRADAAKTANVALLRRLESGSVHGQGTRTIPLKEAARWHTYIANTYANENAMYEMRQKGWVPLEIADLGCTVEESGFRTSPDGYLVRGPQGQEMIWKMAETDYQLLMRAKQESNMRGIGSASKTKFDVANAAGAALGSEAADFLYGKEGPAMMSGVTRDGEGV